eukprot:TRINITY_DN16106_c0_g1_i1.p1 TRINITY_DN16106_c0_g1~~TRINITY_DN16106_c0_g1_i1.p1  ORF type:complete len:208 (+),score=83.21 TRINITY_DN16106_c0_g1_i1:91-714(+)
MVRSTNPLMAGVAVTMSDVEKRDSDRESESESEDEESAPAQQGYPLVIPYCPNCSFPAEFCEFSGKLEGCKPWLETQKISLDSLENKGKKKKDKKDDDGTKELPGGKKKKANAREVVVAVQRRGGRKHITTVKGMDMFDHKLDEIAKAFKKSFSCGAAVVSNAGQPDAIEIQGDVQSALLERLPTKFKIPKGSIYKMEDKQKVPAYE